MKIPLAVSISLTFLFSEHFFFKYNDELFKKENLQKFIIRDSFS